VFKFIFTAIVSMLKGLKSFVMYPIEIGKNAAKYGRVELGLSLQHQHNSDFGGFGDVGEAFTAGLLEGIPYAGISGILTGNATIAAGFFLGTPIVRGLTAVTSYGYYKIKGRKNDKELKQYRKELTLDF
jgi:hypothetical protein